MQMIDVVKRLAELDANNPKVEKAVVKQELNGENAVTGLNKYTGQEVHESISVEELQKLSGIQECGPMGIGGLPMGGMPEAHRPPASFSINASAATGDEVATMLGDILNLAGVSGEGPSHPHDDGLGGRDTHLTGEPPEKGGDDIKTAIQAIDKIEADEADMDPTGADAIGGMTGADAGSVDDKSPTPDVGDMADDVRDMAGQIADTSKDELGLESSRMFDNSPDEQTRAYDPNDFANVVNKIRSFDYSPARGGDNPLSAKQTESVTTDSSDDLASKLMAEFKAFKG